MNRIMESTLYKMLLEEVLLDTSVDTAACLANNQTVLHCPQKDIINSGGKFSHDPPVIGYGMATSFTTNTPPPTHTLTHRHFSRRPIFSEIHVDMV